MALCDGLLQNGLRGPWGPKTGVKSLENLNPIIFVHYQFQQKIARDYISTYTKCPPVPGCR